MTRRFALHPRLVAALALAFVVAACDTSEFVPSPPEAGPARLVIDAAQNDPSGRADFLIDFGEVSVGSQFETAFLIRNVGTSGIRIPAMPLVPPFSTDHVSELVLQPAATAAIRMRFTPVEPGRYEALLPLDVEPPVVFRLTGSAQYASGWRCILSVDERPMHWGDGAVCEVAQELALANLGDATCNVTLAIEGAGFGLERQQITVAPNAVEHAIVVRDARQRSASNGVLNVRAAGAAWDVPLHAAALAAFKTDTFETAPRPRSDFLVVVDDGPAMASYADELKNWATSAGVVLLTTQNEFRWGVTTTSRIATDGCPGSGADGRLLPIDAPERWVTRYTPNAPDAFTRSLDVGTCSTAPNEGLAAAWRAVGELDALDDDPQHPEPADGNAGFVRRGNEAATLQLIFVTASEDLSEDGVGEWADRFLSIHGDRNANLLSALAIVAPPGGCESAMAGTRYLDFARELAGITVESCDPDVWTAALERFIKNYYFFGPSSRFNLTDRPVDIDGDGAWEDDIEVRLNGQVVPARGEIGGCTTRSPTPSTSSLCTSLPPIRCSR